MVFCQKHNSYTLISTRIVCVTAPLHIAANYLKANLSTESNQATRPIIEAVLRAGTGGEKLGNTMRNGERSPDDVLCFRLFA